MSEKENPQTDDDVLHVKIAFDMKTNALTLSSKCPTVMLLGVLESAKSIVIQNQIFQRLEAMAKVAPASRIVLASGLELPGGHEA